MTRLFGMEVLESLPPGTKAIAMATYDGHVIVATDEGAFIVRDGKLEPIIPTPAAKP